MRWVLQNFAHIQLSQVERKLEKRDSSVYTQDLHIEYSIKSTFTFKQSAETGCFCLQIYSWKNIHSEIIFKKEKK